MADESNPSSSNKRPRDEAENEVQFNNFQSLSSFVEDDDTLTDFSDTLFALRMMRAQFPSSIHKASIEVEPFVLRSQLYSSLQDRTQVDRDLEILKQDSQLRIFKLNTGQDDDAIMFMDDYINQLSLLSIGGEANDDSISLLINAGLLTRKLIDPNMFWFAIPNIGSLLKGLSQGRKELVSLLNRTKYKEMMLATLEKKQLRNSPLDIRFHIRDLIGSGLLKTTQTATGIVVRISKD